MSFLISCSTPLSIVHSRGQTLCTNERFSVVVRIDKVEINVRVAALCFHMRPDHIFLGKTKIRRTQSTRKAKYLGFAKESKSSPDQALHIFQHTGVHNLKVNVAKAKKA